MHTHDVVNLFKVLDILPVLYITLISLLAVRTGSKLSGDRSAINLLAGAVAKVISRHWKRLLGKLDTLAQNPAHYKQLQTAHEYLSTRGSEVYILENERNLSKLRDAPPAQREVETLRSPQLSDALRDVALFTIFLFISSAVAGVIVGLLILLREYPEVFLPIVFVLSIIVWIATRPSPPKVEYVPVTGLAGDWAHYQPRSWKDFNQERQAVFMAIVNKEEGGGLDGGPTTADLEAAKKTPLPAPPGITELALSTTPTALDEIQSEVLALRRWHTLVFMAVFTLFVGSIVATLANAFFLKTSGNATIGGVGFAAVTGGLLWGFLPSLRTSHIALALYRSYQIELAKNLEYAEAEQSTEKRQRLEAQAWNRFRTGLNGLWLQENKSRSSSGTVKQGRSKTNSPEGPQ